MPGVSGQGVFLSYRRDDTGPYARSLKRDLSQRIPDAKIFMDLDSIEAGLDFAEAIEKAVNSCAVLVALIGRRWATLTDEDGARRLDNPDDYVRFEIKSALERGVRVIPVLLDGARPLRQPDLPAELHRLARLNAHKMSYDRYEDDANRLLDLIQRVLDLSREPDKPEPQPPTGPKTPAPPDGADPIVEGDRAAARGEFSEAERWFRVAAEAGNTDGMNRLALVLYNSPGRTSEAESWFHNAANGGNTDAMVNLGLLAYQYQQGAGEAEQWFQQAADAGNTDGMIGLGTLAAEREDAKGARQWFHKAVDAGDTDGMVSLGALAQSRGDAKGARKWFQRAADAGNTDGMVHLGSLVMEREEFGEAKRWFQRAAEAGDADGIAGLGRLAERLGDAESAEQLFHQAADAGSTDAMERLTAQPRPGPQIPAPEEWEPGLPSPGPQIHTPDEWEPVAADDESEPVAADDESEPVAADDEWESGPIDASEPTVYDGGFR